jgi:predicted nucleic acid-binding protein
MKRVTGCRDIKDDKFLELAVNGLADVVISGDADLLAMNPYCSCKSYMQTRRVRCRRFGTGLRHARARARRSKQR